MACIEKSADNVWNFIDSIHSGAACFLPPWSTSQSQTVFSDPPNSTWRKAVYYSTGLPGSSKNIGERGQDCGPQDDKITFKQMMVLLDSKEERLVCVQLDEGFKLDLGMDFGDVKSCEELLQE